MLGQYVCVEYEQKKNSSSNKIGINLQMIIGFGATIL